NGIYAQSVGGGGGNGGGGTLAAGKGTSISLGIGGTGGRGSTAGDVSVTSSAVIGTEGARSIGIKAQSVGGAGGSGGSIEAGTGYFAILKGLWKGSDIGDTISVSIGGKGGAGMASGDVSVASSGVVTTLGDNAHGIFAHSVGGGGGTGGLVTNRVVNVRGKIASTATLSIGGSGGTGAVSGEVTVSNLSDIGTRGRKAAGIFAQAVGGGGGDAQGVQNIVVGPDADNSSRNALSIGGTGGTGAAAGAVSVSNAASGRIVTEGEESHGVFAQSVGGGGGNGGEILSFLVGLPGSSATTRQGAQISIGGSGGSGGTGGAVDVVNDGLIATGGAKAHGVLAQSVGGGGGNGGYSIFGKAVLTSGTKSDPTFALSVGGSGGDGGAGGDVAVTNRGRIEVAGDGAYGVLAQSVGGGGGTGGLAVALSLNEVASKTGPSFTKLAVGGAGGDGADGGDVTVTHTGDISVAGANAYGIFAQSVGGSGGNAGFSVSTPAAMIVDHVISTVIGAREGADGTAGAVDVDSTGDIVVTGAGSSAIFAQSINGGGGNVDTFVDFAGSGEVAGALSSAAPSSLGSLSMDLALGGDDVDGTTGADVHQAHTGDLVTTAERSPAVVMQSIGGGGGTATTTFEAGPGAAMALTAMLGARNTDDAGGGAVVAVRAGSILTGGDYSPGALVQSIGGGGGRMVVAGTGKASVALGADPSFSNPGGDMELSLSGDVLTEGANASGQIFQSIGAGGGETYLSGLDRAEVSLGASDGSTGDGGAISLDTSGDTQTLGDRSHGFVLQSIGGGGGLVGTDLAPSAVALTLSAANGGDGGDIDFVNDGAVLASGDDAVGVLAQSLGGGGGAVDGLFRGAAGGAGAGGAIALDLAGNVMSLGSGGIAVMAQSDGADGGGDIDVALDGVIVGGDGGSYGAVPARAGAAGLTSGTAAIVLDGGRANTLTLSEESFLMALNDRIIAGGAGAERVTLMGTAVGNIDLGAGANRLTVADGTAFYAKERVDLGDAGLFRMNGDLYLGGEPYLVKGSLGRSTRAADFRLTTNVSQVTSVTGSMLFGRTATYTPDVYYLVGAKPGEAGDLITVSGDATIAGTVRPILQALERSGPLVLIETGGRATNDDARVIDSAVMDYSIRTSNSAGGGEILLYADPDFEMPGMNRNQRLTSAYIERVLAGSGSAAMGPMFALIANMATPEEVVDAIDRLGSEDYAATQVDAFYSGRRFADTLMNCGYQFGAERSGDARRCAWANGIASTLDRDQSSEYRRLSSSASNLVGGMRFALRDDLYLGFGVGLESFDMDNGPRFSADGDRGELGVSLVRYLGAWEAYGMLSGGTARYDATRDIGISGVLPDGTEVVATTAHAEQRVTQANVRLGLAYRHQPADSRFYLRPGLDLDASYLHAGAVSEGGTDFGLELQDTDQWVLSVSPWLEVGADFRTAISGRTRAFLRGDATFNSTDDIYVGAMFPGASSADGEFRNYSGISKRTGRLTAGLTIFDNTGLGFASLGYQGEWGSDMEAHAGTLSFGVRF
ncbi:MAG TPA: autotransporter outer membrane beta-barrel domain-containing protein, partial [Amaricoccus sp.]|nr:autotransporter outer membrane beta-barrel domain-containing protein [Amaricoccus sp.]